MNVNSTILTIAVAAMIAGVIIASGTIFTLLITENIKFEDNLLLRNMYKILIFSTFTQVSLQISTIYILLSKEPSSKPKTEPVKKETPQKIELKKEEKKSEDEEAKEFRSEWKHFQKIAK